MKVAALAVAKYPRELEYPAFAGREQLLAGEFRRGPQIARGTAPIGPPKLGARRVQMSLIARRNLQNPGLDFDKTLFGEPGPDRPGHRAPGVQKRPDIGMPLGRPPGRKGVVRGH